MLNKLKTFFIITLFMLGTISITLAINDHNEIIESEGGLAGFILNNFQSGNYFILFFILILAGLAINLTPCVYPIIPITIAFFSNQSGHNQKTRLLLGFTYMMGIAFTYGLLGGIAASFGNAFGTLFSKPWFLYSLAAVMFALALSMFDVYQIGLPKSLNKHIKGRSGVIGTLIMGLFVGVAAAPCSGPLLLAVFTEVAKLENLLIGIIVFTLIGLGLGLPYLFLAIFATKAKSLPRSGGWLKDIKAILGFIVFGVGLNYFLLALPKLLTHGNTTMVWAIYYIAIAIYFYLTAIHNRSSIQIGIKTFIILICGLFAGMGIQKQSMHPAPYIGVSKAPTEIAWTEFTAESYAKAKKSGKPIFIDVGADWCKICKEIDVNIFDRPETVRLLENFITLKIDWSAGVHPDVEAYMNYTQELFNMPGPPFFILISSGGKIIWQGAHLKNVADLKTKLLKVGVKL